MAYKRQSGRRSPSCALKDAVDGIAKVKEAFGYVPIGADLVAKALGYKSRRGGAAATKIGALAHFGLLERAGTGTYRVSELAKRVLMPTSPEERSTALATAAASPTLYGEMLKDYDGQAIPQLFEHILARKYDVTESAASDVAANFRETMEFAGLLRNGVLHAELGESGDTSLAGSEEPGISQGPLPLSGDLVQRAEVESFLPSGHPKAQALKPAMIEYQIVLPGKRLAVLAMPVDHTQADFEKLKRWIDFNAEDLVAPPKKAADGEVGG